MLEFLVVVAVAMIVLVYKCVCIVPQGEQWVIERLGRYKDTLHAGMNIIIPFVDRVKKRVNIKECVMDIDKQTVITSDNVNAQIDGMCFIQVYDARKAVYEISDYEDAIEKLAMTQLRSVLGSMELDQMLSQREKINQNLLVVIDRATEAWGVKVTRIDIKDIDVSTEIMEAMTAQMKAERTKRATVHTAEGNSRAQVLNAEANKRAQILQAEAAKESQILEAEASKRARVLQAEGEKESAFLAAEAREREALAEANATKLVSEAISNGNTNAINYFVAQKYTDALKAIGESENSKVVMMPLEASSVIGSVAGIGKLLGETKSEN